MTISYELAKELKEAGFPQSASYWWVRQENGTFEILSEESRLRAFKEIKDEYPDAEMSWDHYTAAPTLSELMDWCGSGFWQLVRIGEKEWYANQLGVGQLNRHLRPAPEEAVAHLWLSLNKKP